uniref:Uncharacterized protein n=1 Tax=Sphaerodactylus townsendi TaxID=933632 RepID=A0ACB8F1B0_9SAUR
MPFHHVGVHLVPRVPISNTPLGNCLSEKEEDGGTIWKLVGLPFLHSHLSGQSLIVQWVVKTDTEVYCFEEQPLDKALQRKPCAEEDALNSGEVARSSGTLEPNRCYRVAVHAWDSDRNIWSTFAFSYIFSRNTSLEDPIQVHVTNESTDSAILWWEPPKALSACPGTLKKYIICCRSEKAESVTYYEANALETQHTILGLQPATTYWVGVWASTDEEEDNACQPLEAFLTRPPGSKPVSLTSSIWFLGIFGSLLITTSIFCFGKKRAKKVLCSALPDPAGSEAVRITETAQNCPLKKEPSVQSQGGSLDGFKAGKFPLPKEESVNFSTPTGELMRLKRFELLRKLKPAESSGANLRHSTLPCKPITAKCCSHAQKERLRGRGEKLWACAEQGTSATNPGAKKAREVVPPSELGSGNTEVGCCNAEEREDFPKVEVRLTPDRRSQNLECSLGGVRRGARSYSKAAPCIPYGSLHCLAGIAHKATLEE